MNYLSLAIFAVSTCGSPGPNNFMIMSSGANYGWRKSIPHVVGINIGFPIMLVAIGVGLDGLLRTTPMLYDVLRPVGVAYLLYLAYRIATAPVHAAGAEAGKPLTVLQAALFQWVNPKAWIMAAGAVVTYATATGAGSYLIQVVIIALVFLVLGTPCTGTWLWLGVSVKRVLPGPRQLRAFNVAMALLLVVSITPVVVEIFQTFQT